MSNIEIKSSFHTLIDHIQDDRMLRDLYNCVADFALNTDNQSGLSEEQVSRIRTSLHQIENGNLIDNETVKEKVKQWLSK